MMNDQNNSRNDWQTGSQYSQYGAQQEQRQGGYRWDYGSISSNTGAGSPKKPNKGLKVFLIILAAVVVTAIFAAVGVGVLRAIGSSLVPAGSSSSSSAEAGSSGSQAYEAPSSVPEFITESKPDEDSEGEIGELMTPREIYKACSPSVVGVLSYMDLTYTSVGQGSGIISSEDGYIITNAHVVEGALSYDVVTTDGEYHPAQLVGYDSQTDVAVLKIEGGHYTAATFGDSDELEVGEMVVAIGNPDGMNLAFTQTVGYVSALNRLIETENTYTMECIQSDAAINPGSSGGPLINEYGQVVGINSAKLADVDYEGIGFSIPINTVIPIVNELIANGKVTGRAMLGITVSQIVSSSMSEYYGIPQGLVISGFSEGSDIEAKGAKTGDIVVSIDDYSVASLGDCSGALSHYKPGDVVQVQVFRITNQYNYSGEYITFSVTLSGS